MNFRLAYRQGVVVLSVLIALGSTVLGFRTALEAGPIWDDPVEIVMTNHLITIGTQPSLDYLSARKALDETTSGGQHYGVLAKYIADLLHLPESSGGGGYYGVVTQYMAHALKISISGEPWATHEKYSVENIALRHLVSFLLTLCAIGALFLVVGIISKNWTLGLFIVATLLSTPVFLGLSSIDDKDAPIAAGLTLLSCGAAILLWRLLLMQNSTDGSAEPTLKPWAANAIAASMIFSGTLLAFGTRTGASVLIAVECVLICALFAIALLKGAARALTSAGILVSAAFAGVVATVLVNPLARKAPVQWIVEGVLYVTKPGVMNLKVYGQTVNSGALPWWYIPGWIVVEYPAAFLALVLLGAVGAISLLRRSPNMSAAYPWAPFIIQGLIIPICIVITGQVLHDRLRHLVFIIPPLCMLAGYGLYICVDRIRSNTTWYDKALAVLGPAFLVINFTYTAIWFPYQYAYMSEFGRSFPQFAFDTEVLGLTITEAVRRMPQHGVKSFRAGPAPLFLVYDPKETGVAVDLVVANWPDHPRPRPGGAYYVHSRPSWGGSGLPDFCRTLFKIERQGVILGVGGEC